MEPALTVLVVTALTIGVVHTFVGVDHTLPFIVLAKSRGWTLRRTLVITAVCGFAHVLTSVVLGVVGIGAGMALDAMGWIQEVRGQLAAWLLIGFGFAYMVWSAVRTYRKRPHSHMHVHADGTRHSHEHDHASDHLHVHTGPNTLTVWTLFIIFALGPCEALIPLLMAPAAAEHWSWVLTVVLAFTGATMITMCVTVAAAYLGLNRVRMERLMPHANTLAGFAIGMSGLAIQVLGI